MTGGGRETRRTPAFLLLALLLATLLAGCLGSDRSARSEKASAASTSGGLAEAPQDRVSGAAGVPESTVGLASQIDDNLAGAADASSEVRFVEETKESGGSGYDADTVLAVRHGMHPDYERAVIDLGTGEEPTATLPQWTLASRNGDGLLRVNLPSANATCVSDGEFGDGLLGSFYVVRAPEGGMFVDFFARDAFRYRVVELRDPARLVVDFEPTGKDLKVPIPAQGGDTVLVEPRPGAGIFDPLVVSGYSRNPEATNSITLNGPRGRVLARRTVRSNDWSHTWGYFESTLDLPPFGGTGTLKVGTGSARDGSFNGVEFPVRAGR